MADEAISQLPGFNYSPQLILPVVDLTRAAGSRNGKLTAGALLMAFQAGAAQGSAPVVNSPPGGIQVAANGTADVELYVPHATNTDVLILGLELKGLTIAAPIYNFQIFAGPPGAANPALLYDYLVAAGSYVGTDATEDFTFPGLLYVPAAAGSNEVWIRVANQQTIPMTINARVIVLEFFGQGPVLGGFVPPPLYTGPLMSVVHVGPSEQFIEPQYGMQALADGGTMYVDAGIYYLPLGITWSSTFAVHPKFGPNPNSARGGGRFDLGITITGAGTYGTSATVFNGRGGYGSGGAHPFRLTTGKGFIYANSPLLVQGVLFEACGGADNISDGEAGIYPENYQSPGLCHIKSCAFDNNENGIFSPDALSGTAVLVPGPGLNVNLLVEDSDFAYAQPNGAAGDGFGSDVYVSCNTVTIIDSHFYGDLIPLPLKPVVPQTERHNAGKSTSGNCIKARSPSLQVTGCWVRCQSGKAIDQPDGGTQVVSNSIFSFMAAADDANLMFGYNTEAISWLPLSDPVYTGCTLYCSRNPGSLLWNNTGLGSLFSGADMTPHKFDWSSGTTQKWANNSVLLVTNRNGSGYMNDTTACVGLDLTPPAGTVFVGNPEAPAPASCPTGAVVRPLNP